MEIIEVTWLDVGLESARLHIDEAKTIHPMVRKNVGYCIELSYEKLVMAFGIIEDIDRDKTVCDQTLVIPRSTVKEIKRPNKEGE